MLNIVKSVNFSKMQGAGNDYVYINCFVERIEDPRTLAMKMSNRHFGIGSDGLVLILPSEKCDFAMRMFNADGSEAEMCGNASRCVGKYLYDKKLTNKTNISLETKAGVKYLTLYPEEGEVRCVMVNMGQPQMEASQIPVLLEGDKIVNYPIDVAGKIYHITCVSMGNPHAVIFVENMEEVDVHRIGTLVEHHPLFPARCNVGFVQVLSRNEIKLRVWERGAGETLACGTGSCAAVTASVLNGYCDRKVHVNVLGGDLDIEWRDDNSIYMTGGAEFVFDGKYIIR